MPLLKRTYSLPAQTLEQFEQAVSPGKRSAVLAEVLQHWLDEQRLENVVVQTIQDNLSASVHHEHLAEQLANDYDELAQFYPELAVELSDEVWLSLENEALLHAEKDVTS